MKATGGQWTRRRSLPSPAASGIRATLPGRCPHERACERISKPCAPANAADERQRGGGMSGEPAYRVRFERRRESWFLGWGYYLYLAALVPFMAWRCTIVNWHT